LKPYWTQIILGLVFLTVAILLGLFLWQQAQSAEADKWQRLSIAQTTYRFSEDNSNLAELAEQFPDAPVGLWAMLYSADADMRTGLSNFGSDKKAGFDKIAKAEASYRKIVDSTAEKSTELQRRSLFGLAYALESGGKFVDAAEAYRQLVDLGEDNPFYEEAERGLNRCQNPVMVELFEKFREFEPVEGEAPGDRLPARPDISFPEALAQPDSGGGEFGK
jgi:tetratricopeptide (TPR) repeat protein